MRLEVREKDNKLEIRNQDNNLILTIEYNNDISYFENVLSSFKNFGVVNYSSNAHYDFFVLKELKEQL